jgi:ATP-binding cassette subfamily F protein 3
MSLLTSQNLGRSFGPVDIFEGISISIPHNARIAIVGSNGVGKTTLLRILAGEDEPTEGSVFRSRGLRVGYLPQEAIRESEGTLWSSCLLAFDDLIELGDELRH